MKFMEKQHKCSGCQWYHAGNCKSHYCNTPAAPCQYYERPEIVAAYVRLYAAIKKGGE